MSRKINKLDIHRIYKQSSYFKTVIAKCLLGVGLMIRVVDSGSLDPEFKPHLAVELILSGVDSACHPFEVSKMSASILCRSGDPSRTVSNSQGECSSAAPTLWTECGPDGWIARYHYLHHQKWKEVMFSPLSFCYLQNRRFFLKDIGQ